MEKEEVEQGWDKGQGLRKSISSLTLQGTLQCYSSQFVLTGGQEAGFHTPAPNCHWLRATPECINPRYFQLSVWADKAVAIAQKQSEVPPFVAKHTAGDRHTEKAKGSHRIWVGPQQCQLQSWILVNVLGKKQWLANRGGHHHTDDNRVTDWGTDLTCIHGPELKMKIKPEDNSV